MMIIDMLFKETHNNIMILLVTETI